MKNEKKVEIEKVERDRGREGQRRRERGGWDSSQFSSFLYHSRLSMDEPLLLLKETVQGFHSKSDLDTLQRITGYVQDTKEVRCRQSSSVQKVIRGKDS